MMTAYIEELKRKGKAAKERRPRPFASLRVTLLFILSVRVTASVVLNNRMTVPVILSEAKNLQRKICV